MAEEPPRRSDAIKYVCRYVCMYLRKFSNHVTYTDRRPDCPSAPHAYQCKIIQSTGMATKLQLKVLFGKKSHGRPDFKKEKTTTKSCLFRRYLRERARASD